jgi:hypothetical protein
MRWFIPLCCLVSITIYAAEPADETRAPLTPDIVASWLESADALQQWGAEKNIRGQPLFEDKLDDLSELMVVQLREQGLYKQVQQFLSQQGFPTPENWADTGERIITAMGAVALGDQTSKYAAALEKLNNDPKLSAEAREAVSANLGMMRELNASFSGVSEADKLVVQPFIDQYRELARKRTEMRQQSP